MAFPFKAPGEFISMDSGTQYPSDVEIGDEFLNPDDVLLEVIQVNEVKRTAIPFWSLASEGQIGRASCRERV